MSDMPEPLTWIMEQGITVVTVFVSIYFSARIVLWQLDKQHKSSLEVQRQNKVDELHLSIYKDLSEYIQTGEVLAAVLSSMFDNIVRTLKSNSSGGLKMPLSETPQSLKSKHEEVNTTIGHIIAKIEQYEISLPNFAFMRIKIFEKNQEISSTYVHFLPKVFLYLNGQPLAMKIPSGEELTKIEKLGTNGSNKCQELMCFLHDLRVEARSCQ